tara:strand:- start:333 stop:719 length:387 start_codon:yes stop_codon:yes gene_type:complete
MVKSIVLKLSIILFFIMFIYSGIDKILSFDKQVEKLEKKTTLPTIINQLGMIGVIILETIGSLLIIDYFLFRNTPKLLAKYVLYIFLLFMIVVTIMYHPPTSFKMRKITPFLSNITTFAGFLLIYKNI